MKQVPFILVLLFLTAFQYEPATAIDVGNPIAGNASSLPKEEPKSNELLLRLGNESNPVDGFLGPFTYGLRGSYTFNSGINVEAGYSRLHEPDTPVKNSVVDEAQLSIRSSEIHLFVFGAVAWKNRMIDMYTNLIGPELTYTGPLSLTLGLYGGSATREDITGNFRGGQVAFSTNFGFTEITIAALVGKIDNGSYRKLGIESAFDLINHLHFPFNFTFSIEERYFDFGNERPISEAKDEFIFVSGFEFHLIKS